MLWSNYAVNMQSVNRSLHKKTKGVGVSTCTEYGTGMQRRICLHSYHSIRRDPVNLYVTVDIRSGAGECEPLALGTEHSVTLLK